MKQFLLLPLLLFFMTFMSCQSDTDKEIDEKDPTPAVEELVIGHWQNTFITSEYFNTGGKKVYEFGYDPDRYLNFDGDSLVVTNYAQGWPHKVSYKVAKEGAKDLVVVPDGNFIKGNYTVMSITRTTMTLQITLNQDPNGYYYQNPDNHLVSGYAPMKRTTYRFTRK
ncbi:hypothetical protein [Pontibacter harenae]|uniref:hypothetical protein n=1 Tax=Pontibacter harenae TaxID=2894083 RepID=UPI001E5518FB|nr:hypothetical protein [Pontibacter harenae]MCC9168725.1 hypothetical protein [Pontibacter harenae]